MPSRRDHFINNQWVTGSGALIVSRNPANGDTLWQGYSAGEKEISLALLAAKKAFADWSIRPLEERITYLKKMTALLEESLDSFALTISKEVGKPLWESRSEVRAMIAKLEISIQAYRERSPERIQQSSTGNLALRHKPHGVIAIFAPFNFPGHLAHGHLIPALLAGNTVILKPSEWTPLTAEMMAQLWEKAGLPAGVFNLLQGGRSTGRLLSCHFNELDGVFFTGSWATGVVLSEQYAKHPEKILALEMGGNNPLIVSDVEDLKAAAYTTIQSAYLTSGQRCSCARRLIVPKGALGDDFIKTLIEMIQAIKVGRYDETPEPFMGPVISLHAATHLLTVQEALKSKGAEILNEMKLMKVDSSLLTPGLIDVTKVANRPDEEIFGPLLQLIRVADLDEAILEANRTAYGLTAGLLSKHPEEYRKFYQKVQAGVVNWNMPLTGASSSLPFGGVGKSGNNRPSAYYAADYCSYPVASMESTTLQMPKEQMPG